MKSQIALTVIALLFAGSAAAHSAHCHVTNADGVSVDDKSLTRKSDCKAKGGNWSHHELHCHIADASGKSVDHPDIRSRAACKKQKGLWEDHETPDDKAG